MAAAFGTANLAMYFVAVGTFVYFVISTLHQWYRLRKVPGPRLAGFSSLWLNWTLFKGKEAPFCDLGDKYGHLVRVAPNVLLTDDPEQLRKMAGARSVWGKDTAYQASFKHPDFDNMFTTTNVAQHDKIKAKLLSPYSGREATAMEPTVDKFLTLMIDHLRKKITSSSGPNAIVDLANVSLYFTMDIITRLSFGKELGFLASDSDRHNVLSDTRSAVKVMWLPLVDSTVRRITSSRAFLDLVGKKSVLGVIRRICEDAVRSRYQPGAPDEKDLLGALVRQGFPEGECVSEMMFAISAGSDTTGSIIRNTMLYLMTTPRVYQKLRETVSTALREGKVSSPIKQEEAKRLPYLQAIIYEGIRMRPPAPILFNKTVPPRGEVVNGFFVPGGTPVGMNLFATMRSPDHWGADARVFRPERFAEADGGARGAMERLVELAFGHGRFGCAGKPLAFMELNKVFFELFRYFDFQLVNPAKPWTSEFYTMFIEQDFLVQISPTAELSEGR